MIYWPKNGYRDNSRILMDNFYLCPHLGGDTVLYPLLINHFVPLINRQIWSSSTRLRQECPFCVLSRLVSKVVPEFWEAGSGQVPCTRIRGDGAGQAAAARGEESPQQCHSRTDILCWARGARTKVKRNHARGEREGTQC